MPRNFERKYYEGLTGLTGITEKIQIEEDVYKFFITLKLDTSNYTRNEKVVTSLLTDIRAIPKVTIVSSKESRDIGLTGYKWMKILIKFSAKDLTDTIYVDPEHFVRRFIIPRIQAIELKPQILSISPVKHATTKK